VKAADRLLQRWRIRRALAWVPREARVLDVGCDDGTLFRLGHERIASGVGVDLNPPTTWRGGTVERLTGPFPDVLRPDDAFDVIVMLAVVEHVDAVQLKEWARECAVRLRPGGRVVITVPAPAVDTLLHIGMRLRLLDGMEAHQHHGFDPSSLPDVFNAAGLELMIHRRFQLGLNHLFVFRRR